MAGTAHPDGTDTIVARASGAGVSPDAIVRLSGPDAHAAVRSITNSGDRDVRRGITAIGLDIGAGGSLPAHAVWWTAPRSYTGEDAVELIVPGGPAVVACVVGALLRQPGVRPAGPGEFTARAFLAGKLSLEQAEGVARVIGARSDEEFAQARGLLSGRTGEAYRAALDELATLLALVEAGIDFTDQEDVHPIAPNELRERLVALHAGLREMVGSGATRDLSRPPRVVLAGPPNAGKSTLFNALIGRDRVTESPIAGATRDVIVEPLGLGGVGADRSIEVELADTPGLEEHAEARRELRTDTPHAGAQRAGASALDDATVVVWCDPDPIDVATPDSVRALVVHVRTKADLPWVRPDDGRLPVCALDGRNLDLLRARIADALADAGEGGSSVPARHAEALRAALGRTEEALNRIANDEPAGAELGHPELIAAELRGALDAIGQIVGGVTPDEVLGRVFASFCVGK